MHSILLLLHTTTTFMQHLLDADNDSTYVGWLFAASLPLYCIVICIIICKIVNMALYLFFHALLPFSLTGGQTKLIDDNIGYIYIWFSDEISLFIIYFDTNCCAQVAKLLKVEQNRILELFFFSFVAWKYFSILVIFRFTLMLVLLSLRRRRDA